MGRLSAVVAATLAAVGLAGGGTGTALAGPACTRAKAICVECGGGSDCDEMARWSEGDCRAVVSTAKALEGLGLGKDAVCGHLEPIVEGDAEAGASCGAAMAICAGCEGGDECAKIEGWKDDDCEDLVAAAAVLDEQVCVYVEDELEGDTEMDQACSAATAICVGCGMGLKCAEIRNWSEDGCTALVTTALTLEIGDLSDEQICAQLETMVDEGGK